MKNIQIQLSAESALVLYDLVARLNAEEELLLADQSEQRVLWDLEAALERNLSAVVDNDYEALLRRARERVRDERGSG